MNLRSLCALAALAGLQAPRVFAQQGSPPADHPFQTDSSAWTCLDRAIQPRVENARATFGAARTRFTSGLPSNYVFSVTTRLRDSLGHFEQVFVLVDSLRGDTVVGRINNSVEFVQGYKDGQRYVVRPEELLDWTILRPDGTEEGNFVGKFLDSLQDRLQQGAIKKPC